MASTQCFANMEWKFCKYIFSTSEILGIFLPVCVTVIKLIGVSLKLYLHRNGNSLIANLSWRFGIIRTMSLLLFCSAKKILA